MILKGSCPCHSSTRSSLIVCEDIEWDRNECQLISKTMSENYEIIIKEIINDRINICLKPILQIIDLKNEIPDLMEILMKRDGIKT